MNVSIVYGVLGSRATGRANHGRQGLKVACPEEIAFHQGWIDGCALEKLARPLAKNGFGSYCRIGECVSKMHT